MEDSLSLTQSVRERLDLRSQKVVYLEYVNSAERSGRGKKKDGNQIPDPWEVESDDNNYHDLDFDDVDDVNDQTLDGIDNNRGDRVDYLVELYDPSHPLHLSGGTPTHDC